MKIVDDAYQLEVNEVRDLKLNAKDVKIIISCLRLAYVQQDGLVADRIWAIAEMFEKLIQKNNS